MYDDEGVCQLQRCYNLYTCFFFLWSKNDGRGMANLFPVFILKSCRVGFITTKWGSDMMQHVPPFQAGWRRRAAVIFGVEV